MLFSFRFCSPDVRQRVICVIEEIITLQIKFNVLLKKCKNIFKYSLKQLMLTLAFATTYTFQPKFPFQKHVSLDKFL